MEQERRALRDDELARLCEAVVYVCWRVAHDGLPGCRYGILSVRGLVARADRIYRKTHRRVHAFVSDRAPSWDDLSAALARLERAGHFRRHMFVRQEVTREPDLAVFSPDVLAALSQAVDEFTDTAELRGRLFPARDEDPDSDDEPDEPPDV